MGAGAGAQQLGAGAQQSRTRTRLHLTRFGRQQEVSQPPQAGAGAQLPQLPQWLVRLKNRPASADVLDTATATAAITAVSIERNIFSLLRGVSDSAFQTHLWVCR